MTTTQITPQMTIGELKKIPALSEVAEILVIKYPELGDERSLEDIGSEDRYDTESLILGMQRLLDISLEGFKLNLLFQWRTGICRPGWQPMPCTRYGRESFTF